MVDVVDMGFGLLGVLCVAMVCERWDGLGWRLWCWAMVVSGGFERDSVMEIWVSMGEY